MNGAELITAIEHRTRVLDIERKPGTYINPEVLAMYEMLPTLSPRWVEFTKRRMAFDLVHLSDARVHKDEFFTWNDIRAELRDHWQQVPRDLQSLPRGWSRVFSDVMHLYGDPNGK